MRDFIPSRLCAVGELLFICIKGMKCEIKINKNDEKKLTKRDEDPQAKAQVNSEGVYNNIQSTSE